MFATFGVVWHIAAAMDPLQWIKSNIQDNPWIEKNWPIGESQNALYLHRKGQDPKNWQMDAYLKGKEDYTYGDGDMGQCIVGGICKPKWGCIQLFKQDNLAMKTGKWTKLAYTNWTLIKDE